MPRGDTLKREQRRRRLKILGGYFEMKTSPEGVGSGFPSITQLAKANRVSTSTIYRDIELLRAKLGPFKIPNEIPLHSNKGGK